MLKEVILETKGVNAKGFLNEAFSEKNLLKVSELLASLFSKGKFGKFKKMTESFFKNDFTSSDGEKGVGFQYLSKNGYMIRFGFVNRKTKAKGLKNKFSVNRVDFWRPDGSSTFGQPSQTIYIPDWLNIVDVVNTIKEALENNSVSLEESVNEEYNPKLSKKMNAYIMSLGYDPMEAGGSPTAFKNKLKKEGVWNDDDYKAFKIEKGAPEDNTITGQMKTAEKKLAERKYADPDVIFKDIETLVKVVATGAQKGLIVAGMAGVGKTFHVSKALKEMFGDPKGPDAKWKHFKGLKGTALGLYRILYQYRKNMTLVFDDSDGFLSDRDCINMLKSAMDTDSMREISWFSNATLNVDGLGPEEAQEYLANLDLAFQDPDKIGLIGSKKYRLPASFEFDSQIIFVSNLPGDKFIKDPDLAAIKSRSIFMDVFLRREDVVERIKSLLQFIIPEMDLEEKEELLEAMKEGEGKLTMRSMVAACGIASSGVVDGGIDEIKRLTSAYISN